MLFQVFVYMYTSKIGPKETWYSAGELRDAVRGSSHFVIATFSNLTSSLIISYIEVSIYWERRWKNWRRNEDDDLWNVCWSSNREFMASLFSELRYFHSYWIEGKTEESKCKDEVEVFVTFATIQQLWCFECSGFVN